MAKQEEEETKSSISSKNMLSSKSNDSKALHVSNFPKKPDNSEFKDEDLRQLLSTYGQLE
jgi:hypothetical protein